jgi:hypothetical protein
MVAVLTGLGAVLRVWSSRSGWSLRRQAAVGSGAVLTYAWHAFAQRPVVPASPLVDRLSDVVFGLLGVGLVGMAMVRAGRIEGADRPEPSSTLVP